MPAIANSVLVQLISWWWVFFFSLLTFGVYEQASHSIVKAIHKLESRVDTLQVSITEELTKQEENKLILQSFSDPAYQEFVLMKGLGVIPEGYKKIYFEERRQE